MTDANAGWIGPSQTLRPTAPPLASPQYGPAWVADCYGTTHDQRCAALARGGWTETDNPLDVVIDSSDADSVARAYAAMVR